VAVLISAGIDPNLKNKDGDAALIVAAKAGKANSVSALLQKHAQVDITDSAGRTALMHAMATENNSMVFTLLEAGAEINMRDAEGRSPLIYAVQNKRQGLITALRKRGAQINLADFHGMTPLHYAVKQNSSPIVRLLLEEGDEVADPNLADEDGFTPLMTAAALGSIEIAKQLISHGAAVDLANNDGATASMIGTKTAKELLKKYETGRAPGKKDVYVVRGSSSDKPAAQGAGEQVPRELGSRAAKDRTSAGQPSSLIGSSRDSGGSGATKMTRLRLVGKPVGNWSIGKKATQITDIKVTVRNVGDYAANGVSVTVLIPGGKRETLTGPEKVERNATAQFILKDPADATAGGEMKAEVSCTNCYR
jgi:ankyrin repeat protein